MTKVIYTILQLNYIQLFFFSNRDPYRKQGDGSDSDLPIRMRNEPKYMWKKWSFNKTEQPCKPTELGPTIPAELSWISPVVRLLIRKLCEPLDDEFTPENTENVMYMLVVEETISPKLPDTKGFKSQVGNIKIYKYATKILQNMKTFIIKIFCKNF